MYKLKDDSEIQVKAFLSSGMLYIPTHTSNMSLPSTIGYPISECLSMLLVNIHLERKTLTYKENKSVRKVTMKERIYLPIGLSIPSLEWSLHGPPFIMKGGPGGCNREHSFQTKCRLRHETVYYSARCHDYLDFRYLHLNSTISVPISSLSLAGFCLECNASDYLCRFLSQPK